MVAEKIVRITAILHGLIKRPDETELSFCIPGYLPWFTVKPMTAAGILPATIMNDENSERYEAATIMDAAQFIALRIRRDEVAAKYICEFKNVKGCTGCQNFNVEINTDGDSREVFMICNIIEDDTASDDDRLNTANAWRNGGNGCPSFVPYDNDDINSTNTGNGNEFRFHGEAFDYTDVDGDESEES